MTGRDLIDVGCIPADLNRASSATRDRDWGACCIHNCMQAAALLARARTAQMYVTYQDVTHHAQHGSMMPNLGWADVKIDAEA